MSALTEVNGAAIAAAANNQDANGIPPEIVAAVKSVVNAQFWKWYENNKGNTVTHVHFWLFTKEIKVNDLYEVFTLLFGAEGEDQTIERPPATVPPADPNAGT